MVYILLGTLVTKADIIPNKPALGVPVFNKAGLSLRNNLINKANDFISLKIFISLSIGIAFLFSNSNSSNCLPGEEIIPILKPFSSKYSSWPFINPILLETVTM